MFLNPTSTLRDAGRVTVQQFLIFPFSFLFFTTTVSSSGGTYFPFKVCLYRLNIFLLFNLRCKFRKLFSCFYIRNIHLFYHLGRFSISLLENRFRIGPFRAVRGQTAQTRHSIAAAGGLAVQHRNQEVQLAEPMGRQMSFKVQKRLHDTLRACK